MLRLILTDAAIADLQHAYIDYEEILPGLGERFLDTWDEYCSLLLEFPKASSRYRGNIRQGRLHVFPYLVMYKIYHDRIVVYSLIHNKQHPERRTRRRK